MITVREWFSVSVCVISLLVLGYTLVSEESTLSFPNNVLVMLSSLLEISALNYLYREAKT